MKASYAVYSSLGPGSLMGNGAKKKKKDQKAKQAERGNVLFSGVLEKLPMICNH